ncbi:MAG: response regulator [Lachnospiraceae bacterium]|nr:response regulator [Lachnospiraceae bacterium]
MIINNERQTILIVDDAEVNRLILRNMLEDDYDLLEAVDGEDALNNIEANKEQLDLILLDIHMPKMNGIEVLKELSRRWWKEDIPVIIISAENEESSIVRAYKLGALDYIPRPFNITIVRHKVASIMRLYSKEQYFARVAAEEILKKHENNNMMVHILSGIVEFRNGESGMHVIHVQTLTDMFMRELMNITDKYHFTDEEQSLIPMAAAMHDIGKISVPYKILNKPGRFNDEEFNIMKAHTTAGYEMLNSLEAYRNDPLVNIAAKVCRWHHERWDGKGYPDGLHGDDIPISAQLVSIADVYDALTSERCYKKAYSYEETYNMIVSGQCGTFNPLITEAFKNLAPNIPSRLEELSSKKIFEEDIYRIIEKTLRPERPEIIID